MAFPPTPDHVWDITTPADTQPANLGGADFRNLKDDVMQRMSLLSGTLANRPTPETVNATWGGAGFGLLYFATDNGIIYQWNGAAWVQVQFSSSQQVAALNLPGQVANIATSTLYAVPGGITAGTMYRVNASISGVGAGTCPGLLVQFTDNDLNNTQNVISTISFNPAPPISVSYGLISICPKPGTNITYSTTGYAAVMTYNLRMRVEIIG